MDLSAGITMATALISAFTERKVYRDIGMTGEITLRGRVLPVGGIREKVLAAHRAGLKLVIIPERNKKDLVEVPKKVLSDLKIIGVRNMDEVLEQALSPAPEKPSRRRKNQAEKTSQAEPQPEEAGT